MNRKITNPELLAILRRMRADVAAMAAAGVSRMFSSVELNLDFASASLTDVVNANTAIVLAHLKRAARYLYGILDARFVEIDALTA